MDRLVVDLTVIELCGLLALALSAFYICGLMLRFAPDDAPRTGFIVVAGLIALPTIYVGLRVFFPMLP